MNSGTETYTQTVTLQSDSIFEHKYNVWVILLFIYGVYSVLLFVSSTFIFTEKIYYRSFSDQLTFQTIEAFLNLRDQYWWSDYVLKPIILLIKICFSTICISIIAVLSSIEFKLKTIFKASLLAEVVFIIAQVVFIISLYINLDDVTFQNATGYYPLSALNFIGIENVHAQWAIYPLQTANLFEVFYVIVISWLLSKQWKPDFVESLNIVIPSYGLGLLLWVVLVAFFTIQVS